MSTKYAKDQPAGFSNHVKNVAVVGASGQQGTRIVSALLATGKHSITALTRPDSKNTMPEGVHIKHIEYEKYETIVEALKGQDALVITLFTMAKPHQEENLVKAAAQAKVPYVIPNQWGPVFDEMHADIPGIKNRYAEIRDMIKSSGLSWVVPACGFWYEYSLSNPGGYRFDIKNRKVTLYNDGDKKVDTSTWEQVGRAVAALLSLKRYPEDSSDAAKNVLSRFENQHAYIRSFQLSQRDMLAALLKATGTKETDWQITKEDPKETNPRNLEKVRQGDFSGFMPAMYSRMFYPEDGHVPRNDNEILGLPKEDLDACTREAVRRANQ